VHLFVVEFCDVPDFLADTGFGTGVSVEVEDIRLDDRNVDPLEQKEIFDVSDLSLAENCKDAMLVSVIKRVG